MDRLLKLKNIIQVVSRDDETNRKIWEIQIINFKIRFGTGVKGLFFGFRKVRKHGLTFQMTGFDYGMGIKLAE